jgi:hypothetical protein
MNCNILESSLRLNLDIGRNYEVFSKTDNTMHFAALLLILGEIVIKDNCRWEFIQTFMLQSFL